MKRKIDVDSWLRKPQYEFFSAFEEPYHGLCVRVDCTKAYNEAKRRGYSFFLYYVYQSVAAAQRVEAFRYRIEDGEVFLYDRIDAGSAIGRSNGTFGFGYFTYSDDMDEFMEGANREVERVRATSGLERSNAMNLIRYSALPWIDFTSLSHARMFSRPDSCPWISFGKMTEEGGRRSMPVSIHVHHALVDGLHVGQYIDCFQELMNR